MAEFVFTSPGVKFRERDLTFVTRNVGVTTLGVVGETQKGPAFEPVFIQDQTQFQTRFGRQSTLRFPNGQLRYQLPYVANAYLEESSQLFVTRVLGLSGYEAGTAWSLTLSAGADVSTSGVTSVVNGTDAFSGNSYLGQTLNFVGDQASTFTGFTKVSDTTFEGVLVEFTATTINNGVGTVDTKTSTITASSFQEYEGMVLATIRSRAFVQDEENIPPDTIFEADSLVVSANDTNQGVGDLFGSFNIVASNSVDSTSETFTVSLDPNSREYLPNVIGNQPKGKNNKIWVEEIFPDLIKKLDADGLAYGVNTEVIVGTSNSFTDYRDQFQTPETPWVVSELRGSEVERLFRFISISDGNAANQEIKISITNIDPITKEFNVLVRDFNDTDQNQTVLESFTRCTMRRSETNFIGNRIGTSNGDYPLRSEFIMLELNEDSPQDAFPAGFEGYLQKDYAVSATSTPNSEAGIAPRIFYKTEYAPDDRLNRVFLGISERGYDGVSLRGSGFNQNIFNYKGKSGFVKSKGFHMDSGATGIFIDGNQIIGEFEVGAGRFRTISDVNAESDTYFEVNSRKFTLVPAGGFGGWDEHRNERSNGDLFRQGGPFDGVDDGFTPSNDYQAWQTAIRTFANPEEITINLFATPALNWSDNLSLVRDAIEMVEEERTDSLYIIDAPDIDIPLSVGERVDVTVANDIVDLFDAADIDSSYSATYYPWIQFNDTENNVRVFIPPTAEVVRAIAFTDNVKFPWFAPAGLQRGVTNAVKSKYRMSLDARDILYAGRINPMADFNDVGTAIFGQKTMQVRESALDRINVRRLLLQAKVLISNIAIRLVFEQNDQTTIDQFLSQTNPILDTIRRERGLDDFRVKMDDSNNTPETRDRNELFGEIFLKPTRAVEFIGITFTITPSGASFDDIA
jgi:hypothetical protein